MALSCNNENTLLRGIIKHSFRTENKLKYYEKVCKNKDICGISMPSEKDNIL